MKKLNIYEDYIKADIDITKTIDDRVNNIYRETYLKPNETISRLYMANNNNGGQPSKLVVGGEIFDVAIETIDVNTYDRMSYPEVDLSLRLLFPCDTKKKSVTRTYANGVPRIKNVIFNDPATIVFWEDGTKTVVKCDPEYDFYDPEKGLTMAIVKKMFGNKGNYFNEIKKWTNEYYEKEAEKNAEWESTFTPISLEQLKLDIEKLKKACGIKSPSEEETKE